MGIESDWAAFCFDRATAVFGNALTHELESVEGNPKAAKAKREQILRKWIPEIREARKFKDPGKRNSG